MLPGNVYFDNYPSADLNSQAACRRNEKMRNVQKCHIYGGKMGESYLCNILKIEKPYIYILNMFFALYVLNRSSMCS